MILPALATAVLLPLLAAAQEKDEPKTGRQIYKETVGSVVAVRGLAHLGERSGAGVVLDKNGLILTSYAIIPEGSERIRVWFNGPKLYSAKWVAGSKEDEVALIKIEPEESLTPIRLGSSKKCDLGETVYSIGNAQNSFINDNQPSFQRGILSGRYIIPEVRSGATFLGELFETTAAVNEHMDGAPLLNDRGEMIGMVTLNYTPTRWMGHAIPVDWIKEVVKQLKEDSGAADTNGGEPAPAGSGTLGFTLKGERGRVFIDRVDADSPAELVGLAEGIELLEISGKRVKDLAGARKRLAKLKAGSLVWLKVDLGEGDIVPVKFRAKRKKEDN